MQYTHTHNIVENGLTDRGPDRNIRTWGQGALEKRYVDEAIRLGTNCEYTYIAYQCPSESIHYGNWHNKQIKDLTSWHEPEAAFG